MANRAYLLNTATKTSDPYLLANQLGVPGNDYLEVSAAAYRIPVPWLLCFRVEDLCAVDVKIESSDDDQEATCVTQTQLPCTTVEQALLNIEQALSLFERIAGNQMLGRGYWQLALDTLRTYPLPYLAMNPLEVMFMADLEGCQAEIKAALGGDIDCLKSLSGYVDGVAPYPVDVLYQVAGPNLDQSRIDCAVALDIGSSDFWHLSRNSPERAKRQDAAYWTREASLCSVSAELESLLRSHCQLYSEVPSVHLGFAQRAAGQPEHMKVLISTGTDGEWDELRSDVILRQQMDGHIADLFKHVCEQRSIIWQGYVFQSSEIHKRRFAAGDYKNYGDEWTILPIEPPAIPYDEVTLGSATDGKPYVIRIPKPICCNCGRASSLHDIATHFGGTRGRHAGRFSLALPYCQACRGTANSGRQENAGIALISAVVGLALFVLLLFPSVLGGMMSLRTAIAIALVASGALWLSYKRRQRPIPPQTSPHCPVDVVEYVERDGSIHCIAFAFSNYSYTAMFSAANIDLQRRGLLDVISA
ncbi:MAG: hypothetical protein JO002_03085 [Burkholderiaceae bacterium]|nr:hypothetical protein [Burkholderiaceae bacterium]